MNFFKRKFSFQDEEDGSICMDSEGANQMTSSQQHQPPTSFSFQSLANKVTSTISAPTSPARTRESLAAALERTLAYKIHEHNSVPIDAQILLIIDSPVVDWSKYFRSPLEKALRIEQAEYHELDLMCTEHSCTVEINQAGRDPRSFTPHACFIGPGAKKTPLAKTITRALISANIPFINSHTSMVAFMDKNNLKKQLRKITLHDGAKIPFLPTIHYPHFNKFHPSTSFPVVISINEGYQGIGKVRVNSEEELRDVEGILQLMGKGDTEVEVEPFVDLKYDLHVQLIGDDCKTFIRRSISNNWKTNVGSSVIEQIQTNERHKHYIRAICDHVGKMKICSIDILISKEGREFIHDINDTICFFGESQEEDRRIACGIMKTIIHPIREPTAGHSETNGHGVRETHQNQNHQNHRHLPRGVSQERVAEHRRRQSREEIERDQTQPHSFADDTMGQLKRTFAGIFGDAA